MSLYLGLDGGGTKTEAAVIDAQGRLLGTARAGGSNPMRISFARALAALAAAAARALASARTDASQVRAVSVGLAGAGRSPVAKRVAQYISQRFPAAKTEVLTDVEIALESIAETGPAVVVIAGTGSAAFGRDAAGKTARAGGLGPWFSDEGSAFDIGRRAMVAVVRAHDAATPALALEQGIAVRLNAHGWQELVDGVTSRPLDRLPEIFPAVAAAADTGDELARKILADAADSLALLAETVIHRLRLDSEAFALGRVGGIFGRTPFLDKRLEQRLATYAAHAQLTEPRFSPAVAAAHRALRMHRARRTAS